VKEERKKRARDREAKARAELQKKVREELKLNSGIVVN